MKQRHQLITQSSVYLHHHPANAHLTIDDLRDMVGHLRAEQLMQRLQRYAAKVQGSSQYWYQRHQELRALLEQKGSPTFFWTVSSADYHWPELHKLMPHDPQTVPTCSMRVEAVIDNPHLTDCCAKLKDWVQQWLYESLDAEWHWFRYEYQARGSTHAHGCAKLKNDPGISQLVTKAAAGWLLSNEPSTGEAYSTSTRDAIIREADEAKAAVLQYADWLVTTCNEAIAGQDSWNRPTLHPSSLSPSSVTDSDADYQDLVNCVERHSHCSAAYCLRKKCGQQIPTCRFDYPRPTLSNSTLTFEKLPNQSIRATLTTKRNDPRINSHSRLLLQNWRANVDIQVIVDPDKCARYMAKYAAKAEQRSPQVSAVFETCVASASDDSNVHSTLRRAMIKAVGERDFGSQETTHLLLSEPLISCSFMFATLSLTGSRSLARDETGELTIQQSLFDQYAARTTLLDMGLVDFASQFTLYKGEIRRRSSPAIVRTFPNYSSFQPPR